VYAPHFRLKSFETISDEAKFRVMNGLLEALTESNVEYLRARPRTPWLYKSGIYYLAEPDGRDDWQDIPDTLERGNGDCEDLATWRCAEWRVRQGVDAQLGITKSDMPLQSGAALVTMYHIVVVLPDGTIEDPSRRLGMR
jgi:hypothetical protein